MDVFPIVFSLSITMIGFHGFSTWFPFSRADFSEFISVLESLNESKNFVNVSSNWQIVD